jgi:hypothetical protein
MNIFNRLTIIFSNQEVMHKITKSPNYKKYHIIAVLPTTTPATLVSIGTTKMRNWKFVLVCL